MDVKESGYSVLRKSISRLATFLVADATLDAPTVYTLYTVPKGKRAIIDHVRAHSNSASLAGMNDLNFGGGAAGITPVWLDAGDISTLTSAQILLEQLSPSTGMMLL
jgi:hypothetical protein